MYELKVAGYEPESFVDGEGIRFVVFTQGCPHHCIGCHNPQTWSMYSGVFVNIEEIIDEIKKNPLLHGITISGGEPFLQIESCTELARKVHELNKTVWVYTGYTLDEVIKIKGAKEFLKQIDILVDGRYEEALRDLTLKFRGSKNQRIIDVKSFL